VYPNDKEPGSGSSAGSDRQLDRPNCFVSCYARKKTEHRVRNTGNKVDFEPF